MMRKKCLKVFAMILIFVMSFSMTSFAGNETIEDNNDFMEDEYHVEGTPNLTRWSYTNSVTQNLSISNGSATMTSSVTGYNGTTTKIEIYFYLQKYSGGTWKNIKTYKDTVNSWYAVKEHTYTSSTDITHGYKYRLRCTYYVYSGRSYEHFMEYTDEKYY